MACRYFGNEALRSSCGRGKRSHRGVPVSNRSYVVAGTSAPSRSWENRYFQPSPTLAHAAFGDCTSDMSEAVHSLFRQPQPGAASTVSGDFPLDENVISCLPQDTKVLSADRYGSSAWTVTARIITELADGTPKKYFLKCATEDAGRAMMEGEYWAMTELFKTIPTAIPRPIARGKFQIERPPTFFFLCDFVDMSNQVPDPDKLCALIIDLHRNSVSPTGKFGFHVRTCNGRTPQAVEWESSWTTCFKNMMIDVIAKDFNTNGPWPELERVGTTIASRIIPRLIGAVESDGRSVKPCLIHADLWEGNTGTSLETGDIILFDAGSYYAHNEMEIGDWRCPYNKVNSKIYTKTYLRHYGSSEPTEEWDDRNRMYSVYFDIIYSVNHMLQGRSVREL